MTRPARRRPRPERIYGIADVGTLGAAAVGDAVEKMAEAGLRWLQLRAKRCDDAELHRLAEEVCRRLEGSQVTLWIDDRADVAALLPVAGVHLGQRDLPPAAARRVLGETAWIGASTHHRAELDAAAEDADVDLVAVGPVYDTFSKEDPDPVVGLELIRQARQRTDKPLVAIGGITADRVPEVLDAGADAAVVLGALCRGDVYANARRLLAAAGED